MANWQPIVQQFGYRWHVHKVTSNQMDDDLNIHTVPSLYKTLALGQNDAKFSPLFQVSK